MNDQQPQLSDFEQVRQAIQNGHDGMPRCGGVCPHCRSCVFSINCDHTSNALCSGCGREFVLGVQSGRLVGNYAEEGPDATGK